MSNTWKNNNMLLNEDYASDRAEYDSVINKTDKNKSSYYRNLRNVSDVNRNNDEILLKKDNFTLVCDSQVGDYIRGLEDDLLKGRLYYYNISIENFDILYKDIKISNKIKYKKDFNDKDLINLECNLISNLVNKISDVVESRDEILPIISELHNFVVLCPDLMKNKVDEINKELSRRNNYRNAYSNRLNTINSLHKKAKDSYNAENPIKSGDSVIDKITGKTFTVKSVNGDIAKVVTQGGRTQNVPVTSLEKDIPE